jgi:hypothetical protein
MIVKWFENGIPKIWKVRESKRDGRKLEEKEMKRTIEKGKRRKKRTFRPEA